MPTPCVARLLAFLVFFSSFCATAAEAEGKDPQLVFFFDADGRRVPVELDKAFSPQLLGTAKAATLRLEPHREFAYGGLRFRFPREYSFEAELGSPVLSMWTLTGNDCTLMIHRYRNQANAEELQQGVVEQMLTAYKDARKKSGPARLELQGETLRGTRLEVELASTRIFQDIFAIRSGKDVVMLIIQDSPKADAAVSAERLATVKLLKESLKLPK